MAAGPAVATILGLVVVALGLWAILLYNRLISLENSIERAWANIDVVLKQRADELRNLAAVVQGYAAHEKALFEHIARARAVIVGRASVGEKAEADAQMQEDFARLLAVAEAYPDLKANENFLKLQTRISGLEDLIADRREFYNESVRLYNTRIREVPDRFVAAALKAVRKEYFRADGDDRRAPALAT